MTAESAKDGSYPKGDLSWFQHDRFGMFIHWGLYSMLARHEWVRNNEKISITEYEKYFQRFDPDLYDPKAWAKAAKDAGMKYFVITTKHHEGFCLWDTEYTDYKATNTPAGRDLLREMVDAFRAEGLKVGFYYSLLDWRHPDYAVDDLFPPCPDCEAYPKPPEERDMNLYAEYMRNQVRELLTNFGKIDVLWFDFSYKHKGKDDWQSEKLVKMIRELQPDIILNNRLDLPGSEDIVTPEQFIPPDGMRDKDGNPLAWEGCQTFSGSWGYHRDESSWKSPEMLVEMLVEHVSKGGNLLLNVGPTSRGEFDKRALDRLAALGEWTRVHGRAIYGCGIAPKGLTPPQDCRYTYNPETNRLYLHLFSWPFKAVFLPGLEDKIAYAQLLSDGSEIIIKQIEPGTHTNLSALKPEGAAMLELPIIKPDTLAPVIEIFLK